MRRGRLRHRIAFTDKVVEQNDYGEEIPVDEKRKSYKAEVKPKSSTRSLSAGQYTEETTHEVTMDYRKGIHSPMTFEYDGRLFEIESTINLGERNKTLILICKEYDND